MEVETPTASPFASSLLFDYVATYMYEGDTPNAERRAAALALDRDLLRELLGQEELRDLIDPGALESVEADLQRMSERTRADSADALHDVLRRVGDLTRDELLLRVAPGADLDGWLAALGAERRAIVLRVGGEERWVAGEDAGLYRDALGAVPPGGLPAAFLEDVPGRDGAAGAPLGADARAVRGPRAARPLRARPDAGARRARARRGAGARRAAAGRDRARVVRPGGAAPAAARVARRAAGGDRAGRPAGARALPAELAGRRPASADRRGHRPAARGARAAAGRGPARRRVGARHPAAPLRRVLRRVAGPALRVGRGRVGRRGRARAAQREGGAVLPRRRGGARPAPGRRGDSEEQYAERAHDAIRTRLRQGACFFTDLLVDVAGIPSEELQSALWDLVWAGEVTNDAFAPLRSPRSMSAGWGQQARAERARRRRFGARRAGSQPQIQGRWSLTAPLFAAGDQDPAGRRRAQAELLLERYGIVTREHVLAEGIPGGFSSLYDSFGALETIGVCQRGYFVEGLGGAQFALPGAAERLRAQRDDDTAPPVVLGATDPAQPYGAVLKWPPREDSRSPSREAGAHVVLAGAEPVLYVERGGKGLQVLVGDDDARLDGGDRGARRRGRARADPQAGDREGQRRARDRLAVGGAPARARLPCRPAQADYRSVNAAARFAGVSSSVRCSSTRSL